MSKVYCKKCETLMEEDSPQWFSVQNTETGHYTQWRECPYCGSDEIVEAVKCAECGEEFAPEFIEEGLCEKCRVKFQILVKKLLEKALSTEGREYIADYVCEV